MESENIYVPEEVAKNFKCCICQKYLFVPPIVTSDGTAFKCGRCSFIPTTMTTPVYGFEKLASYMAFPCTFQGCPSQLAWNEVSEHEAVCKYRIITCPCYHCDESYPIYKLIHHFEEQHKKNVSPAQCNIKKRDIKQPNRCLMRLLINQGQPYLMFNYRDNVHFWISVYSIGIPNRNLTFEAEFTSLDGKCSIYLKNETIVPFNEQEHCINCLDQECKSKFHKFSQVYKNEGIYDKMAASIKIDNIVNTLGSDSINYSVRIVERMDEDQYAEEEDSKKDLQMLMFLENLQCQVCKMLMSAPIYNCTVGHSICKNCRCKLMKCPQCQQELTYSRCFGLEDIADRIEIECKNKKMGCKFTGNVDQNIEHEVICKVIF